jgi:hypothetical protein
LTEHQIEHILKTNAELKGIVCGSEMIIDKFINSGSIRSLYPLLEKWIVVVNKYIKFCNCQDCQWWHTEPALISSLAAAAWQIGGIAIEEYCVEKGKKNESWPGQCDLYIDTGNQEFACEGKLICTAIGRQASKKLNDVKSGLDSACADARKLNKDEGRRLGVCFVVPYLPSSDKRYIDQCIYRWLNKIETIGYSSIAWVFPKKTRMLKGDDACFYPGVVLLIKEVFKQL